MVTYRAYSDYWPDWEVESHDFAEFSFEVVIEVV